MRFATSSRRRTWVSRAVLFAIMCVQAALTLRMSNTAFEDEALYLYSGHLELAHLLHGAPLHGNYASYFSGAPVLYPVLGALADDVGGLAAARTVSLIAMLATTGLLYSLTRRLFNERVGLCAAVIFSVTESALFLGTWPPTTPHRCSCSRWPPGSSSDHLVPLAGLPAGRPADRARGGDQVRGRAVRADHRAAQRARGVALPRAQGADRAGGPGRGSRGAARRGPVPGRADVSERRRFTTTARFQGTAATSVLLRDSLLWGGLPFALAVIGVVAYGIRARTEPGELIAASSDRAWRITLGVVLTGTALLAPADQIHIHTLTSLQKHIGFGLFFAAPLAGIGLTRIIGDHFRRAQVGIAIWGAALVIGMTQSDSPVQRLGQTPAASCRS